MGPQKSVKNPLQDFFHSASTLSLRLRVSAFDQDSLARSALARVCLAGLTHFDYKTPMSMDQMKKSHYQTLSNISLQRDKSFGAAEANS